MKRSLESSRLLLSEVSPSVFGVYCMTCGRHFAAFGSLLDGACTALNQCAAHVRKCARLLVGKSPFVVTIMRNVRVRRLFRIDFLEARA